MDEIIENLNTNYSVYLKKDGKWLEDFRNVFSTIDGKFESLRLEVFSMLPREIKNEILDCLKRI